MSRCLLRLAWVLLPAACGPAPTPWPPTAAEVRLGEETCARCRMIVSDGRFAAQARLHDGGTLVFDDVGCLAAAHQETPFEAEGVFVRSFGGDAWLRGSEAWTIRSKAIVTPMGFGFAAFATRPAAEEAARHDEGAVVAPLSALLLGGAVGPLGRSTR